MDSQTIEIRLKRIEDQVAIMGGRLQWIDEVIDVLIDSQKKIAKVLDR